jgi:hypothetical protein
MHIDTHKSTREAPTNYAVMGAPRPPLEAVDFSVGEGSGPSAEFSRWNSTHSGSSSSIKAGTNDAKEAR